MSCDLQHFTFHWTKILDKYC